MSIFTIFKIFLSFLKRTDNLTHLKISINFSRQQKLVRNGQQITQIGRKVKYIYLLQTKLMKKASPFTYLAKRSKPSASNQRFREREEEENIDLNIFVVTFKYMKDGEKVISEGDPYYCAKCKAILNKFSTVLSCKQYAETKTKVQVELKNNESLWQCEFCSYPNVIKIDKEEIPAKDEVYYLVESQLENMVGQSDSTMIFCIDTSGSMNTTSEVAGKVDLKFGLSKEEIEMLKQFMEPGDEAQFNFLPGAQNQNKTFISRKQCILSAIENQLQEIKKTDPHKRIGFVTFNNEVTVIGDKNTPTVNIVGDKLKDRAAIVEAMNNYKLSEPLESSYESLINQLNKQEAKGQTALGPAVVSAIEAASKGSPGSSVILCTDGLANIGIGMLDPLTEEATKLYDELGELAKNRNITVNIMTIKGEGCKLEVIGKLADQTNGNMKVVNPQKLADDFANVLKDEVVGINVEAIIKLHRAMNFRNEDKANLSENDTVLKRNFANATANTKISFEYEVRPQEDLKFMEIDIDQLKKVPFQTQVLYTSPKGGKYLRVISSQSKTTTDKVASMKTANIAVAQTRATTVTANLYAKGDHVESMKQNRGWADFMSRNFQQQKYQKKQQIFNEKNEKLGKAIKHKSQKSRPKMEHYKEMEMDVEQKCEAIKEEEERCLSEIDSDEDEMELKHNLRERQEYNLSDEEVE